MSDKDKTLSLVEKKKSQRGELEVQEGFKILKALCPTVMEKAPDIMVDLMLKELKGRKSNFSMLIDTLTRLEERELRLQDMSARIEQARAACTELGFRNRKHEQEAAHDPEVQQLFLEKRRLECQKLTLEIGELRGRR